jgi:hypothetical protein
VNELIKGGNIESLKTVDKSRYPGFVMFEIFEKNYFLDLVSFLKQRNYKLLALLMIRN